MRFGDKRRTTEDEVRQMLGVRRSIMEGDAGNREFFVFLRKHG